MDTKTQIQRSGSKLTLKITAPLPQLDTLAQVFKVPISPEKGASNPPHIHVKIKSPSGVEQR